MSVNFHSDGMEEHILHAPAMEIIKHHGACRGKVVGVTAKPELIRLVRINMINDKLDPYIHIYIKLMHDEIILLLR